MKTIKIFLASSGELSDERKEFVLILNSIGKLYKDLKLESIQWETDIPSGSYQGKEIQTEINPLLKKSDIVILLVYSKLGRFTLKEYELAKTKKKKIFVYFKTGFSPRITEEIVSYTEVLVFKEKIEQENKLLFKEFTNIYQFGNIIKDDLNLYLSDLKKKKVPVKKSKKPAGKLEKAPIIPETYQKWLSENCAYMDIDKLQAKSNVMQVKLPEIYIPLSAKGRIDIESMIEESDALLIEGYPGSGKTTLLKHIAYRLAKGEGVKGLQNFLPLLINIRDLRFFFSENKDLKSGAQTARMVLSSYFTQEENGLNLDTIEAFCREKRIIILLDGLDEIEPKFRDIVVTSFAVFTSNEIGNKIVLTGRPHSIEGIVLKRFGGKDHVKILPLNMDQIEEFIKKWFLYVSRYSSGETSKSPEEMIAEIKAHSAIEELTKNPLMLTALCILYWSSDHDDNKKRIPEQRAELYKRFIDNLLTKRFDQPEIIWEFLMRLAFKIHAGKKEEANRVDATETLKEVFLKETEEPESAYKRRIEALFDDIEPKSGLLKFEKGQYRFWHRTFREFLTSCFLEYVKRPKYKDALSSLYLRDEWWEEVVKFYIGYLSIENSGLANEIVHDILMNGDDVPYRKWLLSSQSILEMHKEYREDFVLSKARKRLEEFFIADISPKILVEAGETLGWLGDTREGLKDFIPVAGGIYSLSTGTAIIKPFEIGKFPVTNSWFEEFIKAGGYKNREYWGKEGVKWLMSTNVEHPAFWNDRKWKCPNAPVVGVSWYEAYAFSQWLTIIDKDGHKYCLPSEHEWEAAAAGSAGRVFPWGNEWNKNKCNNGEIEIEKTSSVGIFKEGQTPEGIFDLGGNVSEWTDSWSDLAKDFNVLRGGSWDDNGSYCRCSYRNGSLPRSRFFYFGFRCARILTL